MRITESRLREIISSVIKEHLNERGTNLSSLYHFTDIRGLVGIMRDGFFKLSSRQQDIRDGKNYMSFTRHKSPLEGFALPNESFVRIEVNPEMINSIHGKSIDSFEYYSPNMSKKAARCNPWAGITSDNGDTSAKAAYQAQRKNGFDDDYSEFLNQAEEHLTSAKDSVYAEKAIKRIDICVVFDYSFCETSRERRHIYEQFLTVFGMTNSPLYDKIFIYDNKRDFSLQTDNCTPIREYSIEKLQDALGFDGAGQNVAESIIKTNRTNNNMKKNVVKLNENTLRKIVAESVKKVLKENAWASAPSFKELEKVLDKVTGILSNFSNNIPQEQSDEFMKLVGREWNDLWKSLSSLEETVMRINNPRGLSDGDLTFDDLS